MVTKRLEDLRLEADDKLKIHAVCRIQNRARVKQAALREERELLRANEDYFAQMRRRLCDEAAIMIQSWVREAIRGVRLRKELETVVQQALEKHAARTIQVRRDHQLKIKRRAAEAQAEELRRTEEQILAESRAKAAERRRKELSERTAAQRGALAEKAAIEQQLLEKKRRGTLSTSSSTSSLGAGSSRGGVGQSVRSPLLGTAAGLLTGADKAAAGPRAMAPLRKRADESSASEHVSAIESELPTFGMPAKPIGTRTTRRQNVPTSARSPRSTKTAEPVDGATGTAVRVADQSHVVVDL